MSRDTLVAFALFALVTSITPGPNNLMLLASGVNFGVRKSLPHMLGISCGFFLLVIAVGCGLAEVFARLPWTDRLLRWAGAIYLLYLAWCVATAGPLDGDDAGANTRASRPMRFWNAAAFQWINPKAWVMAVGAFGSYIPASGGTVAVATAAVVFAAINLPSVAVWVLCGSGLRRVLRVRRNRVAFNCTMAALLVLSLYPLVLTP